MNDMLTAETGVGLTAVPTASGKQAVTLTEHIVEAGQLVLTRLDTGH